MFKYMKNFINKLQAGDNTAQMWAFGIGFALVVTTLIILYFTGHYKLDALSPGV